MAQTGSTYKRTRTHRFLQTNCTDSRKSLARKGLSTGGSGSLTTSTVLRPPYPRDCSPSPRLGLLKESQAKMYAGWKRRKCAKMSICRLRVLLLWILTQQKYLFVSSLSSSGDSHVVSLFTNEEQKTVGSWRKYTSAAPHRPALFKTSQKTELRDTEW